MAADTKTEMTDKRNIFFYGLRQAKQEANFFKYAYNFV
jgi:hypothetical protein